MSSSPWLHATHVGYLHKYGALWSSTFLGSQDSATVQPVFQRVGEITVTSEDKLIAQFLIFGFPAGYTRPVPTPSVANHRLANHHPRDLVVYVIKDLKHRAMLGSFSAPPFQSWCHVNPLLTRPKKDSSNRRVIIDLSWPLPPEHSVNRGTPKDIFMGLPKQMHLPSAHNMAYLIKHAGKGFFRYSCEIANAYSQLLLDPAGWPLVCFMVEERYYADIRHPFGLQWAVASCEDVTGLVA